MREIIRAALVIARRDYVATVFSKTFLLFLIGPLLPIVAGVLFAGLSSGEDQPSGSIRAHLAIALPAGEAAALGQARERLVRRLGDDALPELSGGPREPDGLLLRGSLERPVLVGPRSPLGDLKGPVALMLDEARLDRRGDLPAPVTLGQQVLPDPGAADAAAAARKDTARIGQLVLMFLTMLLAGMLLSNLIEEKSNKVIEVLAAAVPVDAIFAGKLVAMLGMSLTGIAVWSAAAVGGALALHVPLATLTPPAVGWPMFVGLGVVYFCCCFLLLGAVFLGIGAQAATVRQVQTISMPVTMLQLGIVAFATRAAAAPDKAVGLAAAIFPWSSPFAMLARAGVRPALWPHAVALVWQAIWIALIIWATARLFRRSVLRSGGSARSSKADAATPSPR